jgi:gamma-glutamylcysteine synthetase
LRLSAFARDYFTLSRRPAKNEEQSKSLKEKPLRLSAFARDYFTLSRRVAKNEEQSKSLKENLCFLAPLREIISREAAESQRMRNRVKA